MCWHGRGATAYSAAFCYPAGWQPPRPFRDRAVAQVRLDRLAPIAPLGRGAVLDSQTVDRGQCVHLGRSFAHLGADVAGPAGTIEISNDDGGIRVFDRGLPGGVWLQVRGPFRLRDGDQIRLGRQTLRFDCADGSGAEPEALASYRGRLQSIVRGEPVGAAYRLAAGAAVLGRTAAEITFPQDARVSSSHARVVSDARGTRLEDLGSTNGTYIRLRSGDAIPQDALLLLGRTVLRVSGVTA